MWRFIHQLTGKLITVDPNGGRELLTVEEAKEKRRSAEKYRAAAAPAGIGLGVILAWFFGGRGK